MVVYLLCFDLSKPIETQRTQLEYWLNYLNSALPLPGSESKYSDNRKWVIMLVGLKSDLQQSLTIQKEDSEYNQFAAWINQFLCFSRPPQSTSKSDQDDIGVMLQHSHFETWRNLYPCLPLCPQLCVVSSIKPGK